MTIDLHFSGDSLAEIRDAMRAFLDEEEPRLQQEPTPPLHVVMEEPEPPAEPEPPTEPEPPAKPETPGPSMEEARAALNELRQKKGPAAVREILTAHNVTSFTDLNPSEYAKVIEEAKQ